MTPGPRSERGTARIRQLVRLAALLAIALALRARFEARAAVRSAQPPPIGDVRGWFADADRLDGPHHSPSLGAHWRVLREDASAAPARIVTTSPEGDGEHGYSGATAVILAFDDRDRCTSARLHWSDDTREHVALVEDSGALDALVGRTPQRLIDVQLDGTSGATLTARAIERSLSARFGGGPASLFSARERGEWPGLVRRWASERLDEDLEIADAPPSSGRTWRLTTAAGLEVASALATSPAADALMGYGGPTASVLLFDGDARLMGVRVLTSFDNEPYVSYVRDEPGFASRWLGSDLTTLASGRAADGEPAHPGLDGVSGATMTSMAVLDAARVTAEESLRLTASERTSTTRGLLRAVGLQWTWRDSVSAAALAITTLLLALSRRVPAAARRRRRRLRLIAGVAAVLGVGLVGGHLLSMAQFLGLAERGVAGSAVLFALAAAAAFGPILGRRQTYCHDVCPHGLLQQWIKPRRSKAMGIGRWSTALEYVPFVLLLGAVALVVIRGTLPAAALEPFDAWSLGVGAPVSLGLAVIGVTAARRVPMAYCRFGCPTGALLGALGRSVPRLSRRGEWLVTAGFVGAALLAWMVE